MIEICGLSKRFGPTQALRDVSIEVRPGMITVIAGPNGSGKTTLIKAMLGMVKADTGHMIFKGQVLNGQPAYRQAIGYMSQDGQFPENLRVAELVDFVKSLRGPAAPTDERLLERLQINKELDRHIRVLSGGTRQRLGAALAFMFRPELLILDEPTAGLDPVSCTTLKDEILRCRSEGRTVIISSHILNDIEELADVVVFLHEGRVMFAGPLPELKQTTGEAQIDRCFAALMEGRTA